MRPLRLLTSICFASTAFSSACKNLTSLSGTADLDTWLITSSDTSSVGNTTYCDVAAKVGGRIRAWFRFPDADVWNGRYVQIGCGGACGYNPFTKTYFAIDDALQAGYALGTTDMGVPRSTGNFGPMHNDLQMRTDWGYLATHLTAVMGKQVLASYYGSEALFSYHLGSSTGGRQSLVEAQRYPEDFNGVFAIAPAYNETGVTTYSITWSARAALLDETNFTPAITDVEADIIHDAVLGLCDGLDGLEDGIVSFPRLCRLNLDRLVCSANSTQHATTGTKCISSTAAEAAKKIYSGPTSLTGVKQVPEGLLPGSEMAWKGTYIPSTVGQPSTWYNFATSFLSFYAFWPDPASPLTPFSINLSDPELLRKTSKTENLEYGGVADMDKYRILGGKIILTQGLQDIAVAPGFARDLWERVGAAMGPSGRDDFMRFYELPGVNHVSGGPGVDQYDALGLLVDWVENDIAPEVVVASHEDAAGNVEFTRPLYRYPFVAGYSGTGNVADWRSFVPVNGEAP
ncbi:feruloyl esterase [Clathrospora elynae]|uniref:Carboxylic ester hydrolase n=1 Tax=Clathrospora elynae TaxID=706981 RepID=A0A6A5SDK8_9PLEO|nr:feruloyl esterase [Clathrospora elynae]